MAARWRQKVVLSDMGAPQQSDLGRFYPDISCNQLNLKKYVVGEPQGRNLFLKPALTLRSQLLLAYTFVTEMKTPGSL